MMNRILLTIFLLLFAFGVKAQRQVVAWQYWFNQADSARVTTSVSPSDSLVLAGHINISGLAVGVHHLNMRFLDNAGTWSGVISQLFYVEDTTPAVPPPTPPQRQMVSWEYWFNQADSSRVTYQVSPADSLLIAQDIDASALDKGVHHINARFRDNTGTWSGVISQLFYVPDTTPRPVPPTPLPRQIVSWEYWFNQADSTRVTYNISPVDSLVLSQDINIDALDRGVHHFNARYLDNTGTWGGVISQLFFKPDTTPVVPPVPINNKMTAYRYWFNSDLSKFQTYELLQPADSLMLDTVMLTGIGNGTHAIHFQFRDSLGLWSGATSDTVTVLFYPRPAGPISGPAKLCLGQGSVTYSVAPIEHAETYVWTLPNGFTGSSDTSFIVVDPATAVMTGSISVYGVNSLGNGVPSSLGVMVSDNPTVSISGDNSLQSGESTTLSAVPSPAGSYAYAWFPGGAETPSIKVTPALTTVYNVTVTDTNTTCSASSALTVDVSVNVRLKVILQGAWSASQGAMTTSLNSGGHLPGAQPYSGAPWNYAGTESLSVLPSNMTDWVLVELRSTPDTVVARRAGILLSDGTVADTSGQAGLNFAMPAGSYYVAVKHRNHLPLMTESRRDLPDTSTYNFTDTTNYPVYGRCVISIGSGRSAMIAGDVNYDSRLRYSGPQNDRGPILTKILGIVGGSSITASAPGYHAEDLSMNGQIRYSGPGNDPALIIQNIVQLTGSSAINGTFDGSVR